VGDALHVVMSGAWHNLRLILAKSRLLFPPDSDSRCLHHWRRSHRHWSEVSSRTPENVIDQDD